MNLIIRPKKFNYKQIDVPIGSAKEADFPESCPCCGAEKTGFSKNFSAKVEYACGGKYSSIPQIQNHTDKYRGICGENEPYAEQERVAMLVIIYNMFCNWTMFPKELKEKMGTVVPTVKDHVVYKISWNGGNRLSAPSDFVDKYNKWVDDNFDKYKPVIDKCLGKDTWGRHLDPRFICGFTDEWEPIFETDPFECLNRMKEVGYNEYGDIRFHSSFGGGGLLPTKSSLEFIGEEKIKLK